MIGGRNIDDEFLFVLDELIGMEKRLGVRSTFFFLNETADVRLLEPKTWKHHGRRYDFRHSRISKVLKELQSGAWEIGLHGSYDSFSSQKKLSSEKRHLEQVLK